jgi:hypothetical protein
VTAGCGLILDQNWGTKKHYLTDGEGGIRTVEIRPCTRRTLTRARYHHHSLRRRMLESRRIFAKFKIGWELRKPQGAPDGLTGRSGSNGASTSGTAKNGSRGSNPEAGHLRGLTLADYPEKDREPPTLLAALERDGRWPRRAFTSVRQFCKAFIPEPHSAPLNALELCAIVPIELPQLCGAVPSSGVRTRARVNQFTKLSGTSGA